MEDKSKVWLHQSNRLLLNQEVKEIQEKLNNFVQQWSSHQNALKAEAKIIHNLFIVLTVDESLISASGCSIDSSVRFIQEIGKTYGIDFFDRLNFAYVEGNNIKTANKDDFALLYQNGEITDQTIVFNNLVKNLKEFNTEWQIPLHQSWHKNFV